MIMADVLAITMFIIGLLLSLNALLLFCRGIWLDTTNDISELCSQGLKKNFFYGLIPSVGTVFFALVIGENAKKMGKILGPTILSLFFLYSCIGLSGFVTMIGQRLIADKNSLWKTTVAGGASFSLACLLPILGWFILFPAGLIIGCGAKMRARSYRKQRSLQNAKTQENANTEQNSQEESDE
ncbi:hypothetical protein [Candidatus Uabimicrobium amorphum]|uniref:Uncharacterized protein n=1 Tax=Uabimicrobium amorphum TaxID=2596890 RepID=A0A5S9IV00_UABAM|nr:hypothetical protein [Candidatus Uabimicrobium amorphum]BBM87620.1 hypothetical protein UABAM_06032 [Candidatus Uabimicrobium amorphum]